MDEQIKNLETKLNELIINVDKLQQIYLQESATLAGVIVFQTSKLDELLGKQIVLNNNTIQTDSTIKDNTINNKDNNVDNDVKNTKNKKKKVKKSTNEDEDDDILINPPIDTNPKTKKAFTKKMYFQYCYIYLKDNDKKEEFKNKFTPKELSDEIENINNDKKIKNKEKKIFDLVYNELSTNYEELFNDYNNFYKKYCEKLIESSQDIQLTEDS